MSRKANPYRKVYTVSLTFASPEEKAQAIEYLNADGRKPAATIMHHLKKAMQQEATITSGRTNVDLDFIRRQTDTIPAAPRLM